MDINKLINELTLEEKASLLSGHKSWHTNKISRVGIPSIFLTDGPHGLRKKKETSKSMGLGETEVSTCFPAAATTGCSWNKDLLNRIGHKMGEECNHYGVNVILGPAVNIKRNPLCGRNFEYFSEEPLLTGKLGASLASGIESMHVGTSVKHFACNNNEANRYVGDSIVDDRALREIYLKGFETIVKEAKPQTIMCSYNKVNGEFASENKTLLTDILRNEWGFDGLVMSDWGAVNDRVKSLKAGLDLEMPGDIAHNRQVIVDACNNGQLDIKDVDNAVRNVLKLINNTLKEDKKNTDFEVNSKLAYEASVESSVLLKNEMKVLPLNKDYKYVIIGDLFTNMRYQGAGSSLINPYKLVTPKEAFDKHNIDYEFRRGYDANTLELSMDLANEALDIVGESEIILFFGGLSENAESEGFDRTNMNLPVNQEYLLNELVKRNKKIVFIFYGGSPVEIPNYEYIEAMLAMYLPGQEGGNATYDLLFGNVSPSGRLAETWPLSSLDYPFSAEFTKSRNDCYKESIFVGYRYFSTFNKAVRFPFGYGLSYAKFKYSNLDVELVDEDFIVTLDVLNDSNIKASEVVQLYVSAPRSSIPKPLRELKGFSKVSLLPHESKTVKIVVNANDLSMYINNSWVLETGDYVFEICKNANEVILSYDVDIDCEDEIIENELYNKMYKKDITKITHSDYEKLIGKKICDIPYEKPYDLNTPIGCFESVGGKFLFKCIIMGAKFVLKKAKKSKVDRETKVKNAYFALRVMPYLSLRAMSFTSEGMLSYRMALGLLDIANGHLFRGIGKLITKEKCFKLKD